MASRTLIPRQSTGNGMANNGGIEQNNVALQGRNRKVLNDIGNLVTVRDGYQGKVERPITRSFRAKLLANAQVADNNNNQAGDPARRAKVVTKVVPVPKPPVKKVVINKTEPDVIVISPDTQEEEVKLAVAPARGAKVAIKVVPVPKPPTKKVVITKPEPDVIVISPDTQEVNSKEEVKSVNNEKSAAKKNKKQLTTITAELTARSKAACGLSNKPKELTVDIDASDADNELAVVEYIDDLYHFYKLAENECRPHDYLTSQPKINEKMRAILVDWLIEVHDRFDLEPETLYLTINLVDRFLSVKAMPKKELQLLGIGCMLIACKYEEIWAPEVNEFVTISVRAYTREQILKMEKTILHKLEWYLTVPTPYVFLTRYIKASIPDDESENMVYFLAELALMNYESILFCPSMVAASAVYVARLTLHKSPAWTETLKFYTGYSESQLRECGKMLVSLHSAAAGHKLQEVYKKYSKAEKFAVAMCEPATCF